MDDSAIHIWTSKHKKKKISFTRSLPEVCLNIFGLDLILAIESQALGGLGFRRCFLPKVSMSLPNLGGPKICLRGGQFFDKG